MHLGANSTRRKDFSRGYRIVHPEKSHAWSQQAQSLMAKMGTNHVYPHPPGPPCPQGWRLQQNYLIEKGSENRMSSGHTHAEPFGWASGGLGGVYVRHYASTL